MNSSALIGLVGLIPLIVVFFIIFFTSKKSLTGDEKVSPGGVPYYWYYQSASRNSPARCEISIALSIPFEFRLDREGKIQRFAKAFGFASMFETGDPNFDTSIYIDSDDMQFCERLRGSSAMRSAVLRLYDKGITSFSASSGRLRIRPKVATPVPDESTLDAMLQDMNEFKRGLPSVGDWQPPPTLLRSKLFGNTFTGLSIAGFVGIFIDVAQPYQLVSFTGLLSMTAVYGIGLAIATLVIISTAFRHSSYGYDVLCRWFIAGLVGTLLCTNVALYNINIHCDHSPAEVFHPRVVGRYITHGRHGSTHYHITLESWRIQGQTYNLGVNSQTYNSVVPGITSTTIYAHPGTLGFEWIEHYEVMTR